MEAATPSRTRISAARLRWLDRQSAEWRDEGLISDAARQAVLARYDAESAERLGMRALMILAALMCAAGIALLIGYNWQRIPSAAKVTMLASFVAAAFGVSAIAYARGRETAGELLAFAGTLLFGNAIWLIAQVLHIQGHYPDAFLWFAIGALACAYLLRSRWIAIEAAVLVCAWLLAEASVAARPIFLYLALMPLALLTAYRVQARVVVAIAAFATAVWVFVANVNDSPAIAVGSVALVGCLFYAIGRAQRDPEFSRWWQVSGLAVLLVSFLPLLTSEFHKDAVESRVPPAAAAFGIVTAAAAIGAGLLTRPRALAGRMVVGVSLAVTAWTALHVTVLRAQDVMSTTATVLYSVLALALGVSLIRTALQSNRSSDLTIGVLFALAFLVLRWADVFDNLFWSGVLLLIAGGGLLLVARLWQRRDRSAQGSLS